jgi:hypothetical protein
MSSDRDRIRLADRVTNHTMEDETIMQRSVYKNGFFLPMHKTEKRKV